MKADDGAGKAAEQITKQIDYLARALKAPRIRQAATRLGDQALMRAGPMRSTWPRCWTRGISA